MRLPPRPDLEWKEDGTPVDRRVNDVYFSVEDGLAESRAVFVSGCAFPGRWRDRASTTIAELGFGTGLNFLATWQLWQQTRPPNSWLNFVSFEGFPLDATDIERALRPWPELEPLAQKLVSVWPPRAKGVRTISWPEERVTLILHIGMIEETLPQAIFKADAWYLDGFSPAKNQAMWDEDLWPLIAQRSAPGARAATFTVAGAVRRGLSGAGFSVEKKPGHGRKRERLEARFELSDPVPTAMAPVSPRIAIIGAGIAGACAANILAHRGAQVTVFEQAAQPARGTSGNPLALVMPRLDAADTAQARMFVDAYLGAQAFYSNRPGVHIAETVHRPRDQSDAARFEKLLSDPPLGLEQLEALPAHAMLHKTSLIIKPAQLIPSLLESVQVEWSSTATIDAETRTVNGQQYDAVILASGWHMQSSLPDIGLTGRLGQIEWMNSDIEAPASAIAGGTYAVACDTLRVWGATFAQHSGTSPQTSDAARIENNQALETLAPFWWQQTRGSDVHSRAGVRATTADRLPVIGAWPDTEALRSDRVRLERAAWRFSHRDYGKPGMYILGGLGSRGFTWAPWAAAILSAEIFADPVPAQSEALRNIVPIRHFLRALKRNPRN
ncbi:MAG: tRNA (5-methylaminomethyl-2-thiouridine)(34)-methyltransferase MnmD [Pseudomonadota bacterium]